MKNEESAKTHHSHKKQVRKRSASGLVFFI